MHLPQILNPQAPQIPLCGGDRTVPQDPLEVVEIPAAAQVIRSEAMAQSMGRESRPFDMAGDAERPQIALKISHRHLSVAARAKQQLPLPPLRVAPQHAPHLQREGDEPVLPTLPLHAERQILQIYHLMR